MTEWLLTNDAVALWSLFASAFLSSTLLPGSSEALLAFYLSQGVSPLSLLLVATLGNTLGGVTSWLLGYWLIKKYPQAMPKKISTKALLRIQQWGWPVLLLSWLPIIGDPLCLAAGWLRVNFIASVMAIICGKFLRYWAIVFLFS